MPYFQLQLRLLQQHTTGKCKYDVLNIDGEVASVLGCLGLEELDQVGA